MSLSVCLLTREPAARVAALLEPLRALADEVVLAADDRIDEATLAGYAALADRLFTVEYVLYERHLAWLHAQCSGDWILRLDGDEVPSAALVRRLPELLARRDIEQYSIRRAWLHGDLRTVLDELPWSTDHNNRLVRSRSTRFDGHQHAHAEPVTPMEFVAEPVYHLELLLASEQQRRAKAIRYEVAQPHLRPAGGGRFNEAFYLPELRESLRTRPVDAQDAALLARVHAADEPVATAPLDGVPHVSLRELDATWPGRRIDRAGCHACIRAPDERITLAAGALRPLFVEVTNDGSEHWPGGLDERPLIRISYHWLRRDGRRHASDAIRTPFPRPVSPGDRVVVPVQVQAPDTPGRYILAIDLVHEDVHWFGNELRIAVDVSAAEPGARLRETPLPADRAGKPLLVPRIIHRVWLGGAPIPPDQQSMGATFAHHHPGWEMRLWTDADLPALEIGSAERDRARSPAELSDLVRYEVLRREGGLYVDTDVECRRDHEPLLRGVRACAALEFPGRLGTAVLAAVPGHRVFERAADECRRAIGLGAHSADATGPYFLSLLVEQEPDFTIFGAEVFYPYAPDEPERAGEPFPDAYAVHHWSGSWLGVE